MPYIDFFPPQLVDESSPGQEMQLHFNNTDWFLKSYKGDFKNRSEAVFPAETSLVQTTRFQRFQKSLPM